jgi:hypothetical protein
MKSIADRRAEALKDPQFLARVEQAREKYFRALTLLQEATEEVEVWAQDLVTGGVSGTVWVISADTEWSMGFDSFGHLQVERTGEGAPVTVDWTFTSWKTEDGEPPEFVKAGYAYEADHLAATAAVEG